MKRRFLFLSISMVASLCCFPVLSLPCGSCHAIQADATQASKKGAMPLPALHVSPAIPIHLTTRLNRPVEHDTNQAVRVHPGPPQCPYETWKRSLTLPILGPLDLRLFCVPAGDVGREIDETF